MPTVYKGVYLRYFSEREILEDFSCSFTGKHGMDPKFMARLDEVRHLSKFPFHITSGYRHPTHPIEAAKSTPGTHSRGIAADIAVSSSAQRYTLVDMAIQMGFKGIGVASKFVHLDDREGPAVMWTYP